MQDEKLRAPQLQEQELSVEELFLQAQESYESAQTRAQEENRTFARTSFFRMDKMGIYRLRVLPLAPERNGGSARMGYEHPVHQMLLELLKPGATGKGASVYVTVTRATDAGLPLDLIDTYRKIAVQKAQEASDEKLAEKIGGGSYGGGLKYGYYHALYVLDLTERAKGIQLLTLSHSQFKELDDRKFKLWQKKLAKTPGFPCPVSSVRNAYPVEIERRKNGGKTEYLIEIDNESDNDSLTKEELSALMAAPRIPEVTHRYTRYHFEATQEFLKQCDEKYGMQIMQTAEMQDAVRDLGAAIPAEDTSSFSFDKRSKEAKENESSNVLSLDDLFTRYEELQQEGLGDKTEQGQELRGMIRAYIEQEKLPVRVTRTTTNKDLLELIEEAIEGEKPSGDGDAPEPEETREEDAQQPERRRRR